MKKTTPKSGTKAKKPASRSRKPATRKTRKPTGIKALAPKTFGQSLNQAPKFLSMLDEGKLTEAQAAEVMDRFLINSDTVRGFCITLLTGDFKASDEFPKVVTERMRAGTEPVFEVMAKNVVMAPTMAVTHRANGNDVEAKASDRVTERCVKLIHQIYCAEMITHLREMHKAFSGEESRYRQFVITWKYLENPAQKAAGLKALDYALVPLSH
jgi:hypothetical protein